MHPSRPRITRSACRRKAMATAAGAAVAILTITGCSRGNSDDTTLPSYTAGTTTRTSTTPTASGTRPVPPTPLGYTPGDPNGVGAWIEVNSAPATTGEQKAVLQAWTGYWQITMQAYNTLGLNLSTLDAMQALNAVAVDKARQNTMSGVALRRQKRIFTIGKSTYVLTSIQVQGNRAVIHGCATDASYEVNSRSKTVFPPPGARPIADVMLRSAAGWRVADTPFLKGTCAHG